jgi:hypothetical protein
VRKRKMRMSREENLSQESIGNCFLVEVLDCAPEMVEFGEEEVVYGDRDGGILVVRVSQGGIGEEIDTVVGLVDMGFCDLVSFS